MQRPANCINGPSQLKAHNHEAHEDYEETGTNNFMSFMNFMVKKKALQ